MFNSKNPVGVDIGSHTVKVCQVRRTGDKYELERFGSAPIYPDGARPSDPAEQHACKVAALKRALAEGGIKSRHSISAVSGESIIVRYLQLPEMPEDELKQALQWEAEEYIPFQLSEVNIDSMILGRANDEQQAKMDVLLVSAKKDLVSSHVSILRAAGLEPRIVDVDSFAFLNCFEVNHSPASGESVALINIGGRFTGISIYTNGVSRFSRDIAIGGETITHAIQARLGCSMEEAERLKIALGVAPVEELAEEPADSLSSNLMDTIRGTVEELSGSTTTDAQSPDAQAAHAINTTIQSLLSEVQRSLEFFEGQYRGTSVARVVLGGGTAMLTNLAENVSRELNLPVETLDPLRRVQISPKSGQTDRIESVRHQLGVGIGLGLRGLAA